MAGEGLEGCEDFRAYSQERLEIILQERLSRIESVSKKSREAAQLHWSRVAKPLGSLGVLEENLARIAGIQGCEAVSIEHRALVVFCGDNGIVAEGVTQTGQEVTASVTSGITRGKSCSSLMAECAGAQVFPVDVGIACPLPKQGTCHPLLERKVAPGTADFLKRPAMTRRETLVAVLTGMEAVRVLKERGYQILAVGEMGIGNTTTSSAVAAVFLGEDPALVTGRGAGLSSEGLVRKIQVIREGIARHRPDPEDGLDVLSKVGGFELAAMAGACLGAAAFRIPVVLDGLISAAAAAAARAVDERVPDFLLASHVSAEPAATLLLELLGLKPAVQAGLCLGEGTGALTLFPLLDMAKAVYSRMITFEGMAIEAYQPLT